MNLLKQFVFALICTFFVSKVCFAKSVAFNKEQLATIKAQHMGKQWLMLLWSVDCPPCFKELAIIQKLQDQYDDLAVVVINTDADNDANEEREGIIKKFNLDKLTNFHFVDGKASQSRYVIDPNWYGELPRSYFVESNGNSHGKSGLVNQAMLTQWLVN